MPQTGAASNVGSETEFLLRLKEAFPSAVVALSSFQTVPRSAKTKNSCSIVQKLPTPLTSLRNSRYSQMAESDLKSECEQVFKAGLKISQEEALYLEESTKLQSLSSVHRTGRITASLFWTVMHASVENPPASLVQEIMGEVLLSI